MSDYNLNPFELALLASTIAIQDPPKKRKPLEYYFDAANELIKAAALNQFKKEFNMSHLEGLQEFSFDKVLAERSAPEEGQKKRRTMVGTITTKAGLRKAIRRVFNPTEAKAIIESRSLLRSQIGQIVADQHRRTATRTEKANQAKNLSSKKQIKKTVK